MAEAFAEAIDLNFGIAPNQLTDTDDGSRTRTDESEFSPKSTHGVPSGKVAAAGCEVLRRPNSIFDPS